MKKQILILMIALLLVGTIYAGASMLKSDSIIPISKEKVDLIKTTGIKDINIKANAITCDDKECYTDIYQEGLIQTEFRTQRNYCITYSVKDKICSELNNQTVLRKLNLKYLDLKALKEKCDNFVYYLF